MAEKLLVLVIDAFRYSYLNKNLTPTLFELAETGSFAKLESVLGYSDTAKFSMITGAYPDKTGIWAEFILKQKISPSRLEYLPLDHFPHMISAPMKLLFSSFLNLNIRNIPLRFVKYFEPAKEDKHIITLFDLFNKQSITYFEYEERNLKILERGVIKRIEHMTTDVVFLKIPDLDLQGHIWGVNSSSTIKRITSVDKHINRILNSFKNKVWNEEFNTIIMSDHGMVQVKRYIDLANVLRRFFKEEKDFIAFYDATIARFWFKNTYAKDKLSRFLSHLNFGKILNERELKEYGVYFPDQRYGELIFLLDPGYLIFPNFYEVLPFPPRGMHGYDPKFQDMLGVFITSNDLKKQLVRIVDVFSIILNQLEISYQPLNF